MQPNYWPPTADLGSTERDPKVAIEHRNFAETLLTDSFNQNEPCDPGSVCLRSPGSCAASTGPAHGI